MVRQNEGVSDAWPQRGKRCPAETGHECDWDAKPCCEQSAFKAPLEKGTKLVVFHFTSLFKPEQIKGLERMQQSVPCRPARHD